MRCATRFACVFQSLRGLGVVLAGPDAPRPDAHIASDVSDEGDARVLLEPPLKRLPQSTVWRGARRGQARIEPSPPMRLYALQQARAICLSRQTLNAVRSTLEITARAPDELANVGEAQNLGDGQIDDAAGTQMQPHGYVLPSYAFQAAGSVISPPVHRLSAAAESRLGRRPEPSELHQIFGCAETLDAAQFAHRLALQPRALTLWHPAGYNLLHHVVRLGRLEHVCVVLQAVQHLTPKAKASVTDGVAEDGLDAVRMSIQQKEPFILTKLLQAGCDPTRQRFRNKPLWFAHLMRPLAPAARIEDAALYAMNKHNAHAFGLAAVVG